MSPRRIALYVGGFLGPFGTVVLIPMFPELREEFDATSTQVGLGYSLYLIPFALALLISGTVGERLGRRRTVRATYLLYAAGSLAAAFAPNLAVFVIARGVQGISNAFITPLLLAGLAEMVPADKFGREVGIYSSFQAAGSGMGPLIGGLAADNNWRSAFIVTAVVAALLSLVPPDGEPRSGVAAPRLKPLLNRRLVSLGLGFFFVAAGPVGIAVIVGVAARDVLDLTGTAAGQILLGGAIGAAVLGPFMGRTLDRFGPHRVAVPVLLGAIGACALLAFGRSGTSLALLWILGASAAAFISVLLQSLGATIMPDNRGGALSFMLSFRFVGHAVGPLVLIPIIEESDSTAFLVGASSGLIALGFVSYALRPVAGARSIQAP